jgi:hypothetical protein
MASPAISNRRPDEGDTDVSIDTPFRFGVRDQDTRADLTTVYCSVTYAKAVYLPEVLPTLDEVLQAADASLTLSVFDDASGAVNPDDPCDQTIETVGPSSVYRIEKSSADFAPQEGVLYVTLAEQATVGPYTLKVHLDLVAVTAAAADYTTHADFVGVVLGMVYWPENTGVFLLFRDDGTKHISVVGPSTDGIGTRSVETVVVYDWTEPAVYTIYFDPTSFRRKALVCATDTLGVETVLAEIDLDTLNEFLPSVRMGKLYAENAPSSVTAVMGIDSVNQGDYVDIYGFSFANYGKVLLVGGSQTGSSSVETLPTELVDVLGSAGADGWSSSGTFEEESTSTALHITATTGPAMKTREETNTYQAAWMLVGTFTARNAVHEGSYNTGMGFIVEDGTSQFKLALLDDFVGITIGIEDSTINTSDSLSGYALPATAVDWEEDVFFVFLGSSTAGRDAVRLFVGEDDVTPVASTSYLSIGLPVTTERRVSFGVIETGAFSGDFYLVNLWLIPYGFFYEGSEAQFPDAQGWTRTAATGSRTLGATSTLVDCTAVGAYDVYSIEDATYDATSGAAAFIRVKVTGWTDAVGAASPLRSEFGPVLAIRTDTTAAGLRFVVNDDGTAYVFLSNEESDYLDVLAQNAAGVAISAEIDLDTDHVYLLDVKPLQHIKLYIDYSTTPAIEAAWPAATLLRTRPTHMPANAVIAFGSLNEDAGVACEVSFLRGGIGLGYDFKVTLDVPEAEMQASVYGSTADVYIDVQDED